jgi:all-trans-retinol 13,14-reductase
VILAKNGYDVTVLEQNYQTGGCLQCFYRKGTKFETGMHFIGSAKPGQNLYKLLNYLEVIDDITLSQLDPERYETFSFRGSRFEFATGKDAFIENLSRYFPREKDNLVRYYDLIERISNASSLHSLDVSHNDVAVSTKYQLSSINDVLDSLTDDTMLKNVLCGENPLFAAERDKTPFSSHAFILDFYNQSAFRVQGGSDAISLSLEKTIANHGGRVLTRKTVTKIHCNATQATAVETADGELIPADIVIANVHPARLMELVDSPLLRPAYRKRMTQLPETVGCFSVYLKFKPEKQPYYNYNFYGYDQMSPWDCEKYNTDNWPRGYLYMHLNEQPNQQWANSGVILSYMNFDDVSQWIGTRVGHRGDDYEQFKREKAERLIELVVRDLPELKESIECYYTSSPLTYLDYTGTEQGAMYGVAKDINLGMSSRVHHRTKIPNLLLTGQNINSHGILGVLVGSIVTCSEFLGENEILMQIKNANE